MKPEQICLYQSETTGNFVAWRTIKASFFYSFISPVENKRRDEWILRELAVMNHSLIRHCVHKKVEVPSEEGQKKSRSFLCGVYVGFCVDITHVMRRDIRCIETIKELLFYPFYEM